jgi:hypothetical protein
MIWGHTLEHIHEDKPFRAVVSLKLYTPNIDFIWLHVDCFLKDLIVILQYASRKDLHCWLRPDTTRVYEIGPYFREVGGNCFNILKLTAIYLFTQERCFIQVNCPTRVILTQSPIFTTKKLSKYLLLDMKQTWWSVNIIDFNAVSLS